MKKIIAVLVVIAACMGICSCSNIKYKKYEVYIADASDGGITVTPDVEYSYSHYEDSKLIGTKKVFVILDNEYELEYYHTWKRPCYKSEADEYGVCTNDTIISAEVLRKTGEIISWYTEFPVNGEEMDKSEEYCRAVACEYMEDNFADGGKCELISTEERDSYCCFVFSRMVGELESCDECAITVQKNGKISAYTTFGCDYMKKAKAPDEETMKTVRSNVDAKLNELYSDIDDNVVPIFGEKEEKYVRLENGRYAIYCEVEVSFEEKVPTPDKVFCDDLWIFIIFVE